MGCLLRCLVILLSLTSISGVFDTTLKTAYPQRKTWWAKYVRHPALEGQYFVTGKVTNRELKYAAEGGFKAVVSVPTITTGTNLANGERFPTTEEERAIAEMAGMEFHVVMPPGGKWASMEQVVNMRSILQKVKQRPVLVHCLSGFSAGFLLLTATAENGTLSSGDIYKLGGKLGLDFHQNDDARKVISEVTGEPIEDSKQLYRTPRLMFANAKRFHSDFAVAGQIGEHNLETIKTDGFKTIVNFRAGVVNPKTGKSSQEEVTLLNVKDRTSQFGARQEIQNLISNRLNASLPTSYISDNSTVNYEQRNLAEFGDDVGYNEQNEREAVEAAGLAYLHQPIGSKAPRQYGVDTYRLYRDDLMAALERGPVLFHCRTAYRAVIMALMAYGEKYGLTSGQALELARDMGWFFTRAKDGAAINMIEGVLDHSNASSATQMSLFAVLSSLVVTMFWSV